MKEYGTQNADSVGAEKKFPARLQMCVDRVGNQAILAKKSGISKPTIGDYLTGKSDPSRERLISLAKAANVSVQWLATGEGPIDSNLESLGFDPAEFLKLAVAAGDLSVRTPEEKEQLDTFRALPPREKIYVLKMMKAMLDEQSESQTPARKTK
jgi:transcriptional regulator with XRE-family HTH domain